MAKSAKEIVQSERFRALMKKRWSVSIILTTLLFIIYYGYILLCGYGKGFLGLKVGVYTNYGIILGVLVIVLSWALTFIYVIWANNVYDKEVDAIKKELVK
jgi:uncharacterized membrane protein (DUF485 family)